jgi:hypothetical protein
MGALAEFEHALISERPRVGGCTPPKSVEAFRPKRQQLEESGD